MVNLKTKSAKHAHDNEKRRQSIKEREKAKLSQSQIIKNALSNSTLSNSSKKIVFSDEENNGNDGSEKYNLVSNKETFNRDKQPVLFNSSESENEDFEIKEKAQFKGKKGFDLLNLQSTYGNDERFKIDERFVEDEKDDLNEYGKERQNGEGPSDEKSTQLEILGSILGTPVTQPEKEKKAKKRVYEMIRYDASKKEHEIYEIKSSTNSNSALIPIKPSTKRKDDRNKQKTDKEDLQRPKVSKEKFYEVSGEIKNRFKEKQEDGQFSLLQTYGINSEKKDEETENEFKSEEDSEVDTNKEPTEIIHEQEINKNKKEINEKGLVAKGIWKESFFYNENDNRLNEALEFINKKNSNEAVEAAENYDQTRRKLKEILRLHFKKQMLNKDPFKNKVGGMNKKQLVNSKFKNSKMINKKKPFEKSPGRKI